MGKNLLLVLGIGVLLAVIAVAIRLFIDYGAACKSSRLSTLLSVRACLMDYAKGQGMLPPASTWPVGQEGVGSAA